MVREERKKRERREKGGGMESSGCVGVMAVVAISSSVALVAIQIHKRLVSDFMKKAQLELCGERIKGTKKKVRFAADVAEPSSDNKEYRRRRLCRGVEQAISMEC